ncbi:MAG: hypothetical protein ACQGQP_07575 [Desulfovibrio sp.]|jgi:F-type H+-transporting ATPase subunit b|nr:hypothetical protein [Mailhella sp.]
MINLDITLFIQVCNFLIGLAIINYLFVRPIRAVIARRRAANEAGRAQAAGLEESAEQKLEGYNARIAQARADAAAARERMRAEAQEAADARIAEAGDEARRIHAEASDRIRRECAQAQEELDARVAGFAQSALKTMLG